MRRIRAALCALRKSSPATHRAPRRRHPLHAHGHFARLSPMPLEERRMLSGVFQFSVDNFYIGENGSNAVVTVSRSGNLATSSNVTWTASGGTASLGSDYSGSSGVLTFAPNQTSRTFNILALSDQLAEGDETIGLSLSNVTGGGSLGTRSTATLTILDASVGFSETLLTSGLNSPVTMVVTGDNRVLIAEQGGAVRVVKNGALLSSPAFTVNTAADDEEGLVGLALDPNFATNGFVYVTYTVLIPTRHNVIRRWTMNGDTANASSEVHLFDLATNVAHFHVGGALHFGADGKLYAATGDNADGVNSGRLDTLHGKLLRLNPDGSIPSDNPFFNQATGANRAIWALGLRNAFTFDVQPGTGRMLISEVGASVWEEVDEGVAGANYGWPSVEGPVSSPPSLQFGTYRNPIHAYDHSHGIAITGAAFYNPSTVSFPAGYVGKFFYTEYGANEIRWIDPDNPAVYTLFRPTLAAGPVDVRVGAGGNMFYLSRGNSDLSGGGNVPGGSLFRITFTGSASPTVVVPPADQLVSVGYAATFSVVASGPDPLSYQWQRDGANISGANSPNYTINPTSIGDDGALFRVVVTNTSGSVTSTAARLSVTSDLPPTATISLPTSGSRFNYGDLLTFAGSGFDPETGSLGANALNWRIDYFTGNTERPAMAPTSGITGGTFQIPFQTPFKETNVAYRVSLTVTDPRGLSNTATQVLLPNTTSITVAANVAGASLLLDGAPITAGYTFSGVVGLERELAAPLTQSIGGVLYTFDSWSDGGAATHDVLLPSSNTTYTANYRSPLGSEMTLVDWGGDYVYTDTSTQRYGTPVETGLNLDGGGQPNDSLWYVPYTDGSTLNPYPFGGNAYGDTYAQGTSWQFYGGAVFQTYNTNFSTRWSEVWSNSPDGSGRDHIYIHADSPGATDGWLFVWWKKEDFLNGSADTLQFTSASQLSLDNYLGGDGLANNNSGLLRFVVRDANQFYISQDVAGPAASAADFVLADPNSRLWAPYNPQGPVNIRFQASGANFQPHFFTDITGVGVYHSNDNSNSSTRHAGINFGGFRVTAATTGAPSDTPGFYDRTAASFFLRNSASQGLSDAVFPYGPQGSNWSPLVGDWNADSRDGVGFFDPATSTWFLKNTLGVGLSDVQFPYGPTNNAWRPLVGDWNGDGATTVGFYDRATATWFLKNANTVGLSDSVFSFGPARNDDVWVPLVGDWNGDGVDTIGFYERSTSTFYLKNSLGQGLSDIIFSYGPGNSGWTPLVGDWDGDGRDGVGFYNQSTATWYLKNTLAQGISDFQFNYGVARNDGLWIPLVGDWDGTGGSNLRLAGAQAGSGSELAATVELAQASPLLDEAKARWAAWGLNESSLARLNAARLEIAPLAGDVLATTLGSMIVLDADAAGQGWFVDLTPGRDEEFEFGRAASDFARGRVDLLTALEHELGHVLGLGHDRALDPTSVDSLMADDLAPGTRRAVDEGLVDLLLALAN